MPASFIPDIPGMPGIPDMSIPCIDDMSIPCIPEAAGGGGGDGAPSPASEFGGIANGASVVFGFAG